MGLSFHEMQAAAQEMSLRAVLDEDLSNYTLCDDGRYEVYTEYTDDAVSEVDKHKNITVNEEQCNLTQEENSQYVPFKLPRYWDGVDLMTKLIQFHYVNINGGSGISTAVNVRFNDSYIICGWLINKSVTAVAGDVTFEITATGTNEKSADYRWRTRPNGKFTVLEALSYDGIIEPSDDWYAGFVKSMQEYTTKAAESARSAQDYADQSKSNLDQVTQITETFTTNAQEVKETAINEINNAKVSGVNAVEAAATEIVNDREKITENANNISSLKGDLVELENNINGCPIQAVAYSSVDNKIDIPFDGVIVKYEETIRLKLSGEETCSLIVQARKDNTAVGQKSVDFVNGLADVKFGGTNLTNLRVNGYSKDVYVITNVTTIGKKVEVLENVWNRTIQEEFSYGDSENPILIKNKIVYLTDVNIGYSVFENCDIYFTVAQTYKPIGNVVFTNCRLYFITGAVLQVSNDAFTLGINGIGNEVFGKDCLFSSAIDTRRSNPNFFAKDISLTILKNGYWLDGEIQQYVNRFAFWENIVVSFIVDRYLNIYSHEGEPLKVKFKGNGIGTGFYNRPILGGGSTVENMVLYMGAGLIGDYITISDNYIVNSNITSSKPMLKGLTMTRNHFIGQNARTNLVCVVDSDISHNEFEITNALFPNATPRTNGEESRNIFCRTIKRSKITNNHIYCGRTGLCVLGDSNFTSDREFSSIGNIIANNIVEGVGEEYISFDGGNVLDVGLVTSVSVDFEVVDTGQHIDGSTNNQTKTVALVTLNMRSDLVGTQGYESGKHIKNYTTIVDNGIFAVNAENSQYFEIVDYSITGNLLEDGDYQYSENATYQVKFRMPTSYSVDRVPTDEEKIAIADKITSDWSIGKLVFVGEIVADNVISNNYINGIGTDVWTSPSDMGGIVLYTNAFNNVVNGNTLFERRIWLQRWTNKASFSKLKIQSNNIIANNTINNGAISVLTYGDDWEVASKSDGNKFIGNILHGGTDQSGFVMQQCKNTLLMGNSAYQYRVENCADMKFIGNDAENKNVIGYGGNTNIKQDNTDDLIFAN